MTSKYRLFSADSHLEISPQRWTHRVPAKYRDRAPRLIKLANGGDAIIVENRPMYVLGLAIAGKPYERHELTGLTYEGSEGAGTPDQRLKEQGQDGIDGEVLFTSAGNLGFWRGIRNDDAYLAIIHAYNEFLAEEYCAANRERLLAMGVIPSASVDAAVKEMEYCRKAGLKGVALNTFPSGKLYPTPDDDRFWAAALDSQMPVTVHVGLQRTDGPLFKYDKEPGEVAFGGDPIRVLTRFGGNSGLNAVQLLLSGVFDRYPKLRLYWAETQSSSKSRVKFCASTFTGDSFTTASAFACATISAWTESCGATTSPIPREIGRIPAVSLMICFLVCPRMRSRRFWSTMLSSFSNCANREPTRRPICAY